MDELQTLNLPLLPLTSGVVLPGMVVTMAVESDDAGAALTAARNNDGRLILVRRLENGRYANVGTIAAVETAGELPSGLRAVVVRGVQRARVGAGVPGTGSALWVQVEPVNDPVPSERTIELAREYRAVVENVLEYRGAGQIAEALRGITDPSAMADTAGYSPDLSFEQKVEILEETDVEARLTLVLAWQREVLADLALRDRIRNDVTEGMEKTQREFLLRQQLAAIRKELGEGDGDEADERYRTWLAEVDAPDAVKAAVERELNRLERISEQSPEHGWIRTWLDTVVELTWGARSDDRLRVTEARAILDADHNGLEDGKDRIVEYLAVRKLRVDRGLAASSERGDPSSALLEVLDPAQNHTFRDHYLEVELDLSEVLFIATANVAETIPGPLLDRMEVIRLDGYTEDEKLAIARDHLLGRQVERNGLEADEVVLTDDAIRAVVADYTREAGVRQLERELGKVLRKAATSLAAGDAEAPVSVDGDDVRTYLGRPRFFLEAADRTAVPGVATGLAVTGTGGDVLFVEATAMPGESGLAVTGQLGDVMKESSEIALSYVRSHTDDLGLAADTFEKRRFHVHVPAGAVPKDGPSAGVTMTTALVSLLTGRPVRSTVGMTGEVTLQGRVLPIGGVKQKVLAAHRAGLTEVVLPARNGPDLDDVPEAVREAMRFHLVEDVSDVFAVALEPADQQPLAA